MPFTTLTENEEKELYRLKRLYWREVVRCEESKAYLAGCVMLGSALETLLVLMINVHAYEAEQTGKVPTAKGKPKPLLEWKYIELLRVAKAAGWLPSQLDPDHDGWSGKEARIGDHAEVVRMVRNLVHPAGYASEHYRRRVTAKYLKL
ncbi:MAG TPA: hypothetical protein VIY49_36845 [Bryobacteraceae bacterium]